MSASEDPKTFDNSTPHAFKSTLRVESPSTLLVALKINTLVAYTTTIRRMLYGNRFPDSAIEFLQQHDCLHDCKDRIRILVVKGHCSFVVFFSFSISRLGMILHSLSGSLVSCRHCVHSTDCLSIPCRHVPSPTCPFGRHEELHSAWQFSHVLVFMASFLTVCVNALAHFL